MKSIYTFVILVLFSTSVQAHAIVRLVPEVRTVTEGIAELAFLLHGGLQLGQAHFSGLDAISNNAEEILAIRDILSQAERARDAGADEKTLASILMKLDPNAVRSGNDPVAVEALLATEGITIPTRGNPGIQIENLPSADPLDPPKPGESTEVHEAFLRKLYFDVAKLRAECSDVLVLDHGGKSSVREDAEIPQEVRERIDNYLLDVDAEVDVLSDAGFSELPIIGQIKGLLEELQPVAKEVSQIYKAREDYREVVFDPCLLCTDPRGIPEGASGLNKLIALRSSEASSPPYLYPKGKPVLVEADGIPEVIRVHPNLRVVAVPSFLTWLQSKYRVHEITHVPSVYAKLEWKDDQHPVLIVDAAFWDWFALLGGAFHEAFAFNLARFLEAERKPEELKSMDGLLLTYARFHRRMRPIFQAVTDRPQLDWDDRQYSWRFLTKKQMTEELSEFEPGETDRGSRCLAERSTR